MRAALRRWRDWRRARPSRLQLLVMAVADRCDQRCLHCQIWQGEAGVPLTLAERLRVVDDALAAGAREALLTGGEPLLSPDLWPVAERLRAGGARLMLATNGMLLERWAGRVAALFDEVYLSLDGADAPTHDRIRGVAAFDRVRAGVRALRVAGPHVRVTTRTTLHALNVGELERLVAAARSLGADHASFLPLDASSSAFGAMPHLRAMLLPGLAQIAELESAVDRLSRAGVLDDGFVLESEAKLRAIARHLRASVAGSGHERPRCDAPWWSAVVEADGAVRPCFFQPAVGDARAGLGAVRLGHRHREALRRVRAGNPVCARCVCPKWRGAAGART